MNKQPLIRGFAQYIEDIYQPHGLKGQALMRAMSDNVFMITTKYDSVTFEEGESRSDSQTYLNRYGELYRHINVQSFGKNNLGRVKAYQPLSFAFVDYPDSRDDKEISSNELRRRGQLYKLHVHAIVALKPGGQVCRRPLLVAGSGHQLPKYGEVKVEAFNPEKGSLENMIEYCAKGAIGVDHGRAFGDLWELFPRLRSKTKRRT
jgi:hypothetical protein